MKQLKVVVRKMAQVARLSLFHKLLLEVELSHTVNLLIRLLVAFIIGHLPNLYLGRFQYILVAGTQGKVEYIIHCAVSVLRYVPDRLNGKKLRQ